MLHVSPVCCTLAVILFVSASKPAAAQVRVDTRLEKARYLAGEPVFVIVDVTNSRAEPARAGETFPIRARVDLALVDQPKRDLLKALTTCAPVASGTLAGFGSSAHAEQLPPDARTTLRYLLQGYDLPPGRYRLEATGRVDVGAQDVTIGQSFDLVVEEGGVEKLREAFAPYLAAADGTDAQLRWEARRAILTAAPPFLEERIAQFTREGDLWGNGNAPVGAEALARIGTPAARTVLQTLALESADPLLRDTFLSALASVATSHDQPFFAALLQDGSKPIAVRRVAALGLGRIGSREAIDTLGRFMRNAERELLTFAFAGLANSRSRDAVPVLISTIDWAPDPYVRVGGWRHEFEGGDVCDALLTLTHYRWCAGTSDRTGRKQLWEQWWARNGATIRVYSNDTCPAEDSAPIIR